jgi:hypothetical protein
VGVTMLSTRNSRKRISLIGANQRSDLLPACDLRAALRVVKESTVMATARWEPRRDLLMLQDRSKPLAWETVRSSGWGRNRGS